MRVAIAIGVLLGLTVTARADATADWDKLLRDHVDARGRVSYDKIDRARFDRVFAAATARPATTAKPDLAYWINAYNLCVWKGVLDRLPSLKSVNDDKRFFAVATCSVGGAALTLNQIENDMIRKPFTDARVHMALNCASASCPELPREAFVFARLHAQLNREAKKFVADRRNVDWNPTTRVVRLSQIFDWYKEDFGGSPQSVIAWINRYRAADAQLGSDAKLEYIDYDWRLNDMRLTR